MFILENSSILGFKITSGLSHEGLVHIRIDAITFSNFIRSYHILYQLPFPLCFGSFPFLFLPFDFFLLLSDDLIYLLSLYVFILWMCFYLWSLIVFLKKIISLLNLSQVIPHILISLIHELKLLLYSHFFLILLKLLEHFLAILLILNIMH